MIEFFKTIMNELAPSFILLAHDYPALWVVVAVTLLSFLWIRYRTSQRKPFLPRPPSFPQYRPAYLGDFKYAGMLWYAWIPQRDPLRDRMSKTLGIPAERITPTVSGHPLCPRCQTELKEHIFLFLHIFRCLQEDCTFITCCMSSSEELYRSAEKVAARKYDDGSLTMRVP